MEVRQAGRRLFAQSTALIYLGNLGTLLSRYDEARGPNDRGLLSAYEVKPLQTPNLGCLPRERDLARLQWLHQLQPEVEPQFRHL